MNGIESNGAQVVRTKGLLPDKYSKATTISAMLMVVFVYINTFSTPALAAIAAQFPEIDQTMIQTLVTIPQLTAVIGSFIAGILSRFISQKKVFILAMFVVLCTGVLPGLVMSFPLLVVCKVLIGIGTGMSFALALAFVPALFQEENDREKIFGLGTSVGAITSIFVQLFGGFLATFGWNYPFFGSLVVIPVIAFIIIKLPDPGKATDAEGAAEAKAAGRSGFTARTWILLIVGMVAPVFFFAFMTNMALVIAGLQLGDPALTGTILAMYSIAVMINGVLVPKIKGVVGHHYFALSFVMFAIAFILLIAFPSIPVFFVAAFFFGLGFGMFNVDIGLLISRSCAPQSATMAMSMYTALNGVGSFVSPIVLAAIAAGMGIASPMAQWFLCAPCMVVFAVAVFVAENAHHKKEMQA